MEDRRKDAVHTTPSPQGGWDNQRLGRKLDHHDTKKEAVQSGRDEARSAHKEHKIHNKDGRIGESNSYGNDPYPPKG